jgi:hypothetical protein
MPRTVYAATKIANKCGTVNEETLLNFDEVRFPIYLVNICVRYDRSSGVMETSYVFLNYGG